MKYNFFRPLILSFFIQVSIIMLLSDSHATLTQQQCTTDCNNAYQNCVNGGGCGGFEGWWSLHLRHLCEDSGPGDGCAAALNYCLVEMCNDQ